MHIVRDYLPVFLGLTCCHRSRALQCPDVCFLIHWLTYGLLLYLRWNNYLFRTYFSMYTCVCAFYHYTEDLIIANWYGLAKTFIVVCVRLATQELGMPDKVFISLLINGTAIPGSSEKWQVKPFQFYIHTSASVDTASVQTGNDRLQWVQW